MIGKMEVDEKEEKKRGRAEQRQEGSHTSFHSRDIGTLEIFPHSFNYILFTTSVVLGLIQA